MSQLSSSSQKPEKELFDNLDSESDSEFEIIKKTTKSANTSLPIIKIKSDIVEECKVTKLTIKSLIPTILLIGEVASGRDSLIDALVGGYTANVLLQRETPKPHYYEFINNDNSILVNNKLPLDFGLGEFNIIDLPSINDTDDKNGASLISITDTLSKADLIIYVTDANSAFQKESEVQSFNKLTAMVQKENDDGHYVKLIILVNKFDDINCHNLNAIYNRIPERTGLTIDNILRFSSHKMLIGNVIKDNKTVVVPNTMRKADFRNVLRSANVIYSPELRTNLELNAKVSYKDIKYDEVDLDLSAQVFSAGDWDKLIGYIGTFSAHLHKDREKIMVFQLNKWRLKCIHEYSKLSMDTHTYESLFDELQALLVKNSDNKYPIKIFNDAIMKMVADVFVIRLNNSKVNFILLQIILQMALKNNNDELISKLINIIDINFCLLTIDTQAYIITCMLDSKYNNIVTNKMILNTLKNPLAWSKSSWFYYDFDKRQIIANFPKHESKELTYGTHESMYIHSLLYLLPKEWRMLLKLSVTSVSYLKSYDKSNIIKYEICNEFITSQFHDKFMHYLSITGSAIPGHEFFNIDEAVKNYMVNFNTFNDVFNIK